MTTTRIWRLAGYCLVVLTCADVNSSSLYGVNIKTSKQYFRLPAAYTYQKILLSFQIFTHLISFSLTIHFRVFCRPRFVMCQPLSVPTPVLATNIFGCCCIVASLHRFYPAAPLGTSPQLFRHNPSPFLISVLSTPLSRSHISTLTSYLLANTTNKVCCPPRSTSLR